MVQYRFFLLLSMITHLCSCDNNYSSIFLQAFSKENLLNATEFDEIFPNINYNQAKWKASSQFKITDNCEIVKTLTNISTRNVFNISNSEDITSLNNYIQGKFLKVACSNVERKPRQFSLIQVWVYGLLTVTFINTFALLGILFMPLIKKTYYNSVMTFMVTLAVGSLLGTAILILIPESMKISEMVTHGNFDKNEYKWKATTVFAGFYMFFIAERLIKIVIYRNKGKTEDSCLPGIDNLALQSNGDTPKMIDNDLSSGKRKVEPVAWMIIFGDALHNFVDGLSIGAAFSYDVMTGISVSVATMCEELPHELGDFAVLVSSGMTFKRALFWNTMSAMTCYLGFIIGAIVGEVTTASVWIFAIAGGMFLYISLVDMMHDIISTLDNMVCSKSKKLATFALQNLGLWTGYTFILIVALYGDKIKFGG